MLIVGLGGTALADHERAWLQAAAVVGVILFTRNYRDREQLRALVDEIRALRPGPFLICVDQEGGPVQRFRSGFTELPALARLGERYRIDAAGALALAEQHAWLMASELCTLDIDLSFAPVADLGRGNRAIGERAFDADPVVVAAFIAAYVRGLHAAGMAATLKHFPGHGSVLADTHFDAACDPRPAAVIEREDGYPFAAGIAAGAEAVMMAHVSYPDVCGEPAGYSSVWIQQILRARMGFAGIVFSDDIGMKAADTVGGIKRRIEAHLAAGCDLVLVCAPDLVAESIAAVAGREPFPAERLRPLLARPGNPAADPQWQTAAAALATLTQEIHP
ncbi:MAG: beta-N-acetylhexosaminidase [Lysobacterales bacterium]